jgi:hypothetical protein
MCTGEGENKTIIRPSLKVNRKTLHNANECVAANKSFNRDSHAYLEAKFIILFLLQKLCSCLILTCDVIIHAIRDVIIQLSMFVWIRAGKL